jgi:hypothetical protein
MELNAVRPKGAPMVKNRNNKTMYSLREDLGKFAGISKSLMD